MPTLDTLERFIARVESNAHAEAIEEFYTERAAMRENQAPPRIGRDVLVANTVMEELACQRWEGERIAEETFFYDPAQMTPKQP
jgi:hypothetical protein